MSAPTTVTVYGASDDLVEVDGAVSDEFGCFETRGGILTFNEGTKLRVNYAVDGTGCWRIERIAEGSASYSHVPADGEDTDNYSDRVTLVGDLRSVRFRKAKAPVGWAPGRPEVAAVERSRSYPDGATALTPPIARSPSREDEEALTISTDYKDAYTTADVRALAQEMAASLVGHECQFSHPDWRHVNGLHAFADMLDAAALSARPATETDHA